MKKTTLTLLGTATAVSLSCLHAMAETPQTAIVPHDSVSVQQPATRTSYMFNRLETPLRILPYNTTAYTTGDFTYTNMRGSNLHTGKDTILHAAVNPSGMSVALVTHDRKGRAALDIWHTTKEEKRLHRHDVKKYGTPVSTVFTPDARRLGVATGNSIVFFDTRKYEPVDRIDLLPVVPSEMVMSDNGYFLVLTSGNEVVVYNFADKTIRKRLDMEVPVTCVAFTSDSQMMGVLTDDGLLSIYDTRTFDIRTTVDDLGEGKGFSFTDNGKYVAVVTSPQTVEVINLLKHEDRRTFTVDEGNAGAVCFVRDVSRNPVLTFGGTATLHAERLQGLEPYYAKLVSDEADLLMNEWLKMRPGETMEDYAARINDSQRQRRLFEDEVSTRLAGDLVSMSAMSLGSYNRDKELLAIDFTDLPSIYLPVAVSDIGDFHTGEDLTMEDVQYGLLPDDSFELVYARFINRNNGKTYLYDNHDRVAMDFLQNDDNIVSLEILQQQQLEEMRLQEIKEKVVAEARLDNVISDHTTITVDSKVVPDYNANGDKILNYVVKFTYQVDPGFSATEDFAPGKYIAGESGAANAMLTIVRQAFEGDFAQYLKGGKKLRVNISGTADASPIVRGIPYDGSYGEFEDEPVWQDGQLSTITVTRSEGIRTNEQLAFLRAMGVRDYLENNVEALSGMERDYRVNVEVSADKGGEHRRITSEFTFIDVFN